MSEVSIIVEGESDKKFLIDYVSKIFSVELKEEDFIVVGGNAQKLPIVKQIIKSHNERGKSVLLIFDADQPDFNETLNSIHTIRDLLGLSFDVFLFPDNCKKGNLETLLRSIINTKNKSLFKCIENYADCIDKLQLSSLREFNQKAKIYVYVDSFTTGGSAKVDARNYKESTLWDLKSDNLTPLNKFLGKFIQSDS